MVTKFKVGDSVYRNCETKYVYLVKSGVSELVVCEPKIRWKVIKIFEQFGKFIYSANVCENVVNNMLR